MSTAIPNCPDCNGEDFLAIPDSLALACKGCGFVWIDNLDGTFETGCTITQWAKDLCEAYETKKGS